MYASEEKVEYINKNVRYLDYLSVYNNIDNNGWENIKDNIIRLSTLRVPVVENGLEWKAVAKSVADKARQWFMSKC